MADYNPATDPSRMTAAAQSDGGILGKLFKLPSQGLLEQLSRAGGLNTNIPTIFGGVRASKPEGFLAEISTKFSQANSEGSQALSQAAAQNHASIQAAAAAFYGAGGHYDGGGELVGAGVGGGQGHGRTL